MLFHGFLPSCSLPHLLRRTPSHGAFPPRQQYFTSKDTAALAGRYDPNLNGFRATAEKTGFGADGRPQYRFGGVGAASTVPTSATGRYLHTNTLGSSGLPPVTYKVCPNATSRIVSKCHLIAVQPHHNWEQLTANPSVEQGTRARHACNNGSMRCNFVPSAMCRGRNALPQQSYLTEYVDEYREPVVS